MNTSHFLSHFKRLFVVLLSVGFLSGCVTFDKKGPMTAEDYMKLAEQTQDAKVTALTANTDPQLTDLGYLVDVNGATYTSNKITLENLFDLEDAIGKKSFEDEDWGDMSVSSNSVTLDADVVAAAEMSDSDHGFFTYSSGVASLDTGGLTSANLLGALTNETGTGVAVFGTSPTFATSIVMGSADLSEAELEIIDGGLLTTTQLNYLQSATGTTGTASTSLVFSTSPTFVTPVLGTITSGVGTALTALNGENIQDDTIDNDSIDWSDMSDLTTDGAIDADKVDSAHINWVDPITVPFGEKLYFGDSGMNIWPSADGTLSIVSDTNIASSGAWTHTGNITATTYGAAAVTDEELGWLDTVSSNIQDQIDAIGSGDVSADAVITDHAVVRGDGGAKKVQDSGVLIDDSDNITIPGSITQDAVALPKVQFNDSGNPGTDKEIAIISANFLSGGDGAEDGEVTVQVMVAGTERNVWHWDADTESATIGDSATGEDLIWNFSADPVTVTTNSSLAAIDFGTINLATDALDLSDGDILNVGEIAVDKVDADGAALALGDGDETVAVDSSGYAITTSGAIEYGAKDDTDAAYDGVVVTMTVDSGAGSSAVGQAYHVDTDGELVDADNDADATVPCIGIAIESGVGAKKILMHGRLTNDAWGWTAGDILYLSGDPTTTTGLTTTPPAGAAGDRHQQVGIALSDDTIWFAPHEFW